MNAYCEFGWSIKVFDPKSREFLFSYTPCYEGADMSIEFVIEYSAKVRDLSFSLDTIIDLGDDTIKGEAHLSTSRDYDHFFISIRLRSTTEIKKKNSDILFREDLFDSETLFAGIQFGKELCLNLVKRIDEGIFQGMPLSSIRKTFSIKFKIESITSKRAKQDVSSDDFEYRSNWIDDRLQLEEDLIKMIKRNRFIE